MTPLSCIIVSNKSVMGKGKVVQIVSGDHKFTPKERLKEWVAAGNDFFDFPRKFTLIYCTDKTPQELIHLINGYYFNEPDRSSTLWIELYNNGETVKGWDYISQYLVI